MVRYRLGCELSQEVNSPTTFIFNLEVARLKRHLDLDERLVGSPDLPKRTHSVSDVHNRYFAVNAKAGPLEIRYEAEVTLEVFRTDPAAVAETPLTDLPLDIMPFLLPSRYVSSDRLAAFANREFGGLPKGHRRVTAVATGSMTTSTISADPPTSRRRQTKAF
jgi:hypothetical protein